MAYTNSPLVAYTKLSPNHSGQRTHSIDRITPHCVVGQLSAESICGCFISTSRQASCNYGIGKDGRVSLCVEEKNRSWCSSSRENDQRAITIECASDNFHPYAMNDAVYTSLIKLCTDICKRNGKTKLIWLADKNKTLNYTPAADEMVLSVHRWFAAKACPGDWLYARLGDLAAKVTAALTIVIITHEMSVVESTCTHVAIIDDGQLAECGTVESVFSQPKSAAAKKLIFRAAGADSGAMGERMIRIVFEGSSADEPTISDLAMQCHVAVNIRYADTREVSGKLFGQMILQLPEDHLQQEKAIYFLQNKGLRVEEVNGYVHG